MNRHGQALVEFVLVLPVLLLIIFAFIDFGRIIICKTHLENVMDSVILLDNSDVSSFLEDDDYHISYSYEIGEYKKVILTSNIEVLTPGLKSIIGNPYTISVERSVLNE